ADRRANLQVRVGLAGPEDLVHLAVADVPEAQPVAGYLQQLLVAAAAGGEQGLHRHHPVGAVDAGQFLARAGPLAGDVAETRVDRSLDAGGEVGQPAFVELDKADRVDLLLQSPVLDLGRLHARQDDAVRRELHPADDAGRQRLRVALLALR